jgi:heavy metal sensor kinase
MPTITTRLTMSYVAIFGAITILVAWVTYNTYEQQRRASIDAELENYASLLMAGVGGQTADINDIFDELLEANKKPKARFKPHRFVLTSKDSIVFETNVLLGSDSLQKVLGSDELTSAATLFKTVSLGEVDYRIFSKEIRRTKGQSFHLIVVTSLERLYESMAELRTSFLLMIPLSLLFAAVAGWYMARRALRPVRAITTTAAAISSSSLDKRVPVNRNNDELSHLAQTFNDMIARLDATFKSQQQFIADASHDLRTPLTVLQMELELLLLSNSHEDHTRTALEKSLIEIDRLTRLASDLLLLARADSHQLKLDKTRFRFDELILECMGQLKELAERKNISFQFNMDEPAEIVADEALIRRLIINLLDNAIKFSPQQSLIRVDLQTESTQTALSIADQGPGIAAEEIPKVFQRFHRAESSRTSAGSGLGLAIAKAVADEHEGAIAVESRPSGGTIFTVTLPR